MKSKLLSLIPILILTIGCSENSTDDLTTIIPPGPTITYTNTIKNIIDTNCIACHSSPPVFGAPMPLLTYANVKEALLSRGLIDRVSRPQGAPGMMPLGGTRLPQSTINLIIEWQNQGLAE